MGSLVQVCIRVAYAIVLLAIILAVDVQAVSFSRGSSRYTANENKVFNNGHWTATGNNGQYNGHGYNELGIDQAAEGAAGVAGQILGLGGVQTRLSYSAQSKSSPAGSTLVTTYTQQQEQVIPQQDDANLNYDNHIYYKSAFITNPQSFNEHWTEITKSKPLRIPGSRNTRRRDINIKLTFDFPLRGHILRSITIANGGFINLAGESQPASQYIAPLMADFDNKTTAHSGIKLYDDGQKFSAIWENIPLVDDPSKTFTFAATLYKSGDIIFAYKDIPISVQTAAFNVGISDKIDTTKESYNVGFNYPFSSGTLLKLIPILSQDADQNISSDEKMTAKLSNSLIKPDQDLANLKYETYTFYKAAFIGNVEFFNQYWTGLSRSKSLRPTWKKSSGQYEAIIELSFDFSYYNHYIRSITVTSGGYISLGNESQYIAPLWADFEIPADVNSAVKVYDDGDLFIVVWDKLYLKGDKDNAFTFAVILFDSGEIVYLYNHIPGSIQMFYDLGYEIQFGLSDGKDGSQQIQFKNYDVSSGTLFKILPLQTPKIDSEKSEISTEWISADEDVSNLKYTTYSSYNIAFIGNLEYFDNYWLQLFKTQPLKKIWRRNAYRYETTVDLSFEFLFYGKPLRHLIVSTGGYIIFGDDEEDGRALKHYIAPLAADFDDSSTAQKVRLYDDGEKFTAIWDNVQLRTDKSKTFTFVVTLYKTGDIVFTYKYISLSIQHLYENYKEVKIGFADLTDDSDTSHRVLFNNYDIATATIIKIVALDHLKEEKELESVAFTSTEPLFTEKEIITSTTPAAKATHSVEPLDVPTKSQQLVTAATNPENLQYETYDLYKATLISNPEYFRNIWQRITNLKPVKTKWTKNLNRYETVVELSFDFPFYDHLVREIKVTSAGFIILGDTSDNFKQYIAPLKADYDESLFEPSSVKISQDAEKITVLWNNLALRLDKDKVFTFSVTLYNTGEIEFTYKYISMTIQLLFEKDSNLKVGISDLINDSDDTRQITFNNYDISSESVLKIVSLTPVKTFTTEVTTTILPSTNAPMNKLHSVEPLAAPKNLKLIKADSSPTNIKYEIYPSYKAGLIYNPEYFNDYWSLITKSKPIKASWTKKLDQYETDIDLLFEFSFYGRPLKNLKVSSAGYIFVGDNEEDLTQYIAPLKADFDESKFNPDSVNIFQDKEKLSVIWDSLPLRSDKTKLFTFGVTIYKNGDITYIYKYISVAIQSLYENESDVIVGFSDLTEDTSSTEPKEVEFKNYEIVSGSILKILSHSGATTDSPTQNTYTSVPPSIKEPATHEILPLDESPENLNLILSVYNPADIKFINYNYYKAGLITNPEYFNDIWLHILAMKPLRTNWNNNLSYYETTVELQFEFPYYGIPIKNLKVTNSGFIILVSEEGTPKRYISPLMAEFDQTSFKQSSVKLFEDNEKFIVIWEQLPLQSDTTKTFTFGIILYNNGDIDFLYKYVSLKISSLYEVDDTVVVGISDLTVDNSGERREISFYNFDINSNSVLKISPLAPTPKPRDPEPLIGNKEKPKPEKIIEELSNPSTTAKLKADIHFVTAEDNLMNLKFVDHSFYRSTYVGNKPLYNEYWTEVKKTIPHKLIWQKTVRPYETQYELSFDFPFYDFIIRNVTITSGGFILLGDHLQPDGAVVKQYIAPLMSEFDELVFREDSVKILDDGKKFIVLWENMYLREDHDKPFTFAAILYKNGDITFVYENIPTPMKDFYDNQRLAKIGISDDYLSDPSRWVTFMNYDIESKTVLKLLATFTPNTTPTPQFTESSVLTTIASYVNLITNPENDELKATTSNVPYTNSPPLLTTYPKQDDIEPMPNKQITSSTTQTLLDKNQLSVDIIEETQNYINQFNQAATTPVTNELNLEPVLSTKLSNEKSTSELTNIDYQQDLRFQFQSHHLYKSVMIKNPEYFNDHWERISKSKSVKYTWQKTPFGYETTLDTSFELPFYDIILPKITVNSAGFINLNDYLLRDDIEALQYIAPLKGEFDLSNINENILKIYDDNEKLSLVWENLPLKKDKSKTFTFALTLYVNGDIIFAYKQIPLPINTSDGTFDIGVSAAYVNENNDYDGNREISFKNYKIDSGSILAIIALPLSDESIKPDPVVKLSDSPFLKNMSPSLSSMLLDSMTTTIQPKPTSESSVSSHISTTELPNIDKKSSSKSDKFQSTTFISITDTYNDDSSTTALLQTPTTFESFHTTPSTLFTESDDDLTTFTIRYPSSSTTEAGITQSNKNQPSNVQINEYPDMHQEELKVSSGTLKSYTTEKNPQEIEDLVKPQENVVSVKYKPHSHYQSALIANVLYFEEYWSEIHDTKPVKKVWKRSLNGYETTVDLDFDFPFYDRILRNITVNSNGYIDLGDEVETTVLQYITPLKVEFEDTSDKNVKLYNGDNKFTVVWENLRLKSDKSKRFSFSVSLYTNGDIIFGYKDLPVPVQKLLNSNNEIQIGVSDAHVSRNNDEERHLMTFTNYDISSGSILKISYTNKQIPDDCKEHTEICNSLSSTTNHINQKITNDLSLTLSEGKSVEPSLTDTNSELVKAGPTTPTPTIPFIQHIDTSAIREQETLDNESDNTQQEKSSTLTKITETTELTKVIEATTDPDNLKFQFYGIYKVAFIRNPEHFNQHWSLVTKSRPLRQTGGSGTRRSATLSFDFPFFGKSIRNIVVSSDGFVDLSGEDTILPTYYIAPLMTKFDAKAVKPSTIKFHNDGDKFTITWENLHLPQNPDQMFTFAVTLYKNGDIVFAYKIIPSLLTLTEDYKVGISDKINSISFNNYDIVPGTILKFITETQNEPKDEPIEETVQEKPKVPVSTRERPTTSTSTTNVNDEVEKPVSKLPGRRRPTKPKETPVKTNNEQKTDIDDKTTNSGRSRPSATKTTNSVKSQLIKAAESPDVAQYNTYDLYKVALIGNVKFFNDHWLSTMKTRPIRQTEGSLTRRKLQLTFDFPFQGRTVKNIVVTGEGYIDFSGSSGEDIPKVYIAPLLGKFDVKSIKPTSIKLYDDGDKFTAIWENIYFQEEKTNLFTFAVTLYKNGDIVFAYKNIPTNLQQYFNTNNEIKIGIYDGTGDEPYTLFFTNYDITSTNIMRIIPLSNEPSDLSPDSDKETKVKVISKASSTTPLPSTTNDSNENVPISNPRLRGRPKTSALKNINSRTTELPDSLKLSSQKPDSLTLAEDSSQFVSTTQSSLSSGTPEETKKDFSLISTKMRGRPKFNDFRGRASTTTEIPSSTESTLLSTPDNQLTIKSSTALNPEEATNQKSRGRPKFNGFRGRVSGTNLTSSTEFALQSTSDNQSVKEISTAGIVSSTAEEISEIPFTNQKIGGRPKFNSLRGRTTTTTEIPSSTEFNSQSTPDYVSTTVRENKDVPLNSGRFRGRSRTTSSTSTEASSISDTSSQITQEEKSLHSDNALQLSSTEATVNTKSRGGPKFASWRSKSSTTIKPASVATPITEKNEPSVTSTTSAPNEPTFRKNDMNILKQPGSPGLDTVIGNTTEIPDMTLNFDKTKPEKEVEEESQTSLPLDTDISDKSELLLTTILPTNPPLSTSKDPQNKIASTSESYFKNSENPSQETVIAKEVAFKPIKSKPSHLRFTNSKFRTSTTTESTLSLPTESSQSNDNSEPSQTKQTSITESFKHELSEENNGQSITSTLFSNRPLSELRASGRTRSKSVVSTEIPEDNNEDLKKSTISSFTGVPKTLNKVTGYRSRLSRPKIIEPQPNTSEISQISQTEITESPVTLTTQTSYRTGLRLPARNLKKPIVSSSEISTDISDQELSLETSKDYPAPSRKEQTSSTISPSHKKTEDKNEQPVTSLVSPKRPLPGLRAPGRLRGKIISSTTVTPDNAENDQEILSDSKKDNSIQNHIEQDSTASNKPEEPEDHNEQPINSSLLPKRRLPGFRAPGNIHGKTRVNNEDLKDVHENYSISAVPKTTEAPDTSTRFAGLRPTLSRPTIGESQPVQVSNLSPSIKTEDETSDSSGSYIEKINKPNLRLPARKQSKNTLPSTENSSTAEYSIEGTETDDTKPKNEASVPSPNSRRLLPGGLVPSRLRGRITQTSTIQPAVARKLDKEPEILEEKDDSLEPSIKESYENPLKDNTESDDPHKPDKPVLTYAQATQSFLPKRPIPGGLASARFRGKLTVSSTTHAPVSLTQGPDEEVQEKIEALAESPLLPKRPIPGPRLPNRLQGKTPGPNAIDNTENITDISENNLKVTGSLPKNVAGSHIKITGFKTRTNSSHESSEPLESLNRESHPESHTIDNLQSTKPLIRPLVGFRRPGGARGKISVTSVNYESLDSADITSKENEKDSAKVISDKGTFSDIKTEVIGAKISQKSEIEEDEHDLLMKTDGKLKTDSTRTTIKQNDEGEHPVGTLKLTGRIGDNNGLRGGSLSGGRYKISGVRRIITPGIITTLNSNDSPNDAHEITSGELMPELMEGKSLTGASGASKTFKITGTRVVSGNIQPEKDSSENNGEVDSAEIIDASKLASGAFINSGRRISGRFKVTGVPKAFEELNNEGEVPEEYQEMLRSGQLTQENIDFKLNNDGSISGNGRQKIAYKITGTASGGSEQEVADLIKSKVIPDLINSSKFESNVGSGPLTDEKLNGQLNSRSFVAQAQQPIIKMRRQKISYGG